MIYFGPELILGVFILTIMVTGIYYSTLVSGIVGILVAVVLSLCSPELLNVFNLGYVSATTN